MSNRGIAIVQAVFHEKFLETMLKAATKEAKNLKLIVRKVVSVPGALEAPLAIHRLLKDKRVEGVVVLGIIERGETKHGMVMGQAVIQSIIDMQLKTNKPIGVGIIGPEVFPSQIEPRLKGHAVAAVKAVNHML